jgi:hypothetical protein
MFCVPLTADQRTALQFRIPVVSLDVPGLNETGLGDVSLKLTHVAALTWKYGLVLTGEFVFDTFSSDFAGNGTEYLKLGVTYARFLPNGAIFAPAVVHIGTSPAATCYVMWTVIPV